jgi:uncharacterized membrane protein
MLELLLTLHILFAVWLMSNLIASAYWKARTDRTGNPEHIATTAEALARSDMMFNAPGIAGVLVTGIWMGGITGWDRFKEPWLAVSFILTILMAVLWLAVLMPQVHRMARWARDHVNGSPHIERYQRAGQIWSITSGIVTLIPVIILVLMVFKP